MSVRPASARMHVCTAHVRREGKGVVLINARLERNFSRWDAHRRTAFVARRGISLFFLGSRDQMKIRLHFKRQDDDSGFINYASEDEDGRRSGRNARAAFERTRSETRQEENSCGKEICTPSQDREFGTSAGKGEQARRETMRACVRTCVRTDKIVRACTA